MLGKDNNNATGRMNGRCVAVSHALQSQLNISAPKSQWQFTIQGEGPTSESRSTSHYILIFYQDSRCTEETRGFWRYHILSLACTNDMIIASTLASKAGTIRQGERRYHFSELVLHSSFAFTCIAFSVSQAATLMYGWRMACIYCIPFRSPSNIKYLLK